MSCWKAPWDRTWTSCLAGSVFPTPVCHSDEYLFFPQIQGIARIKVMIRKGRNDLQSYVWRNEKLWYWYGRCSFKIHDNPKKRKEYRYKLVPALQFAAAITANVYSWHMQNTMTTNGRVGDASRICAIWRHLLTDPQSRELNMMAVTWKKIERNKEIVVKSLWRAFFEFNKNIPNFQTVCHECWE